MDREQIIKQLEAIQSGNIGAIARPLPKVWVKRFAKDGLIKAVEGIYGEGSKLLNIKRQPFVIATRDTPMWFFMDKDDGTIENCGQCFTREEYDSIIADLQKESDIWVETKTATRVIHFVKQEGNEPLEESPENVSIPTPTAERPKSTEDKPAIVMEHPIEDLIEVPDPEPEETGKPKTYRLSTWVPGSDMDRRERMEEWKRINKDFL
jgi:hypothetical protein